MLAAWALAACGGDGERATSTASVPDAPAGPDGQRTGDGEGGVELTEIGRFEAPLYVTQPAGEEENLYVVEQGGRVVRVTRAGKQSTFLDVSDEIKAGGEQGLLSMAFAPDFERSGLLYVDYTDTAGDTRVVEYRSTDGGATADPDSAREILAVDQPYANHNGGLVLFGPDDKLYIGLGDGGSADDPERRGLDTSTLLGKILRIDPRPDGDSPYTIPDDNPLVGEDGAREEIWAYGLRNPWRFAFDPATDSIAIADVGQDEEEEVDVIDVDRASGANFGWSAFEGDARFNEDQPADGAIAPTVTAAHDDGFCSITGGSVVRDPRLSSLYGRYVYGDFCRPAMRSFDPADPDDDLDVGIDVPGLSSFGTDGRDRVYVTSLEGSVYRLDPAE